MNMSRRYECAPMQTVSIPLPVWESFQGNYFVGQTPTLQFGPDTTAWAGLINPRRGGVPFNLAAVTVSNLSETSILAQLWFNPALPSPGLKADSVTTANTNLCPLPYPRVEVRYDSAVHLRSFASGVNPIDRVVPGYSTTVADKDGKFIFPGDGRFAVLLIPTQRTTAPIPAIVAFGWWEQDPYAEG